MGLRMSMADDDKGVGAFSQDILKIQISGPDVNLPASTSRRRKLTFSKASPSHDHRCPRNIPSPNTWYAITDRLPKGLLTVR